MYDRDRKEYTEMEVDSFIGLPTNLFYDFMFVPIWYGLNRPDISEFMEIINSTEEVLVQLELMTVRTGQHNPFTLMGGGLFHLAFGAILTGSAVGLNK